MAEDTDTPDGAETDGDARKKAAPGKKRLVILGAAGVAVAAILGIVGFLLFGGGEAGKKTLIELPGPSVYVELPTFIADLKTDKCRSPVVKLTLSLEIAGNHRDRLTEIQPQLMDALRMLLRDRTRQDLAGREGAENLRAAVQTQAANMMAPAEVRGVLFKEFLLQ
ncbi:MAG: flagellar basal body-associated FliL family protein [Hyphomicrobiales bacterium]|nr:flagellar basal body-associated FliL family protein [Hyphomicrobiales bacterium]